MSVRPELLAEVARWIHKAENDLRAAEHVLTIQADCPTEIVCFHCQQCAEKYLKAFLVLQEVDFPKTHDLVLLFNLAGGKETLELNVAEIQPLNRYSVEGRYPGVWEAIDRAEAERAVEMARDARRSVRKRMPEQALRGEK